MILPVLALNFPARGRKRLEELHSSGKIVVFWPLISPQGDGNDECRGHSTEGEAVLALNFPAMGRKHGKGSAPFFLSFSFWPLISPQGDGNKSESTGRVNRQEGFGP